MLVVIKCLGYGGAERLLVDLMASRDARSFDYEVAYVLAAEDALVPAVRAEGVPVHALGATANWDLRWMPRFATLLRRGDFDVVHFHLPYAAALGRLVVASLRTGRRPAVVYTEHSLWEKTAAPVRYLNRLGIGRDQALVAVSSAAHDALPEALGPRAEVVVHGVHLRARPRCSSGANRCGPRCGPSSGSAPTSWWCSRWPTCGPRRAMTSCSTRPAWWATGGAHPLRRCRPRAVARRAPCPPA